MRFTPVTPALLLSATLLAATPFALAQSGNSAVDANGTPVGVAEPGTAGGPEIVGTDGLIRYENSEAMWEAIASNWDTLGEKATERWGEIDGEALMATEGEREPLVSAVSEGYDISEADAEREVTAWATSVDDGL